MPGDPVPDSLLRVLLAEDDAVHRHVALLMLRRMGVGAHIAINGVEALRAVRDTPYDVVLMDIQMPEMDGLEASRQIRRDGRLDHQPVIVAMTASGTEEERAKFRRAGMDRYLAKPILLDELAGVLAAG